jgi:superfamily II DNA or RNA helicase
MIVLPTGAGKTITAADLIHYMRVPTMVVAHRQELVSQLSLAIAREGVVHNIIAPKNVIKNIVRKHMNELGRTYYNSQSQVHTAGVDTLIRRDTNFSNIKLWIQDEAHHVVKGNKWHKTRLMFPNAVGLGVTATPLRADGKGLGLHADGIFTKMIVGPNMRQLINEGYLTDYRIFAPETNIDLSQVNITSGGDYSQRKLSAAMHKSTITGDIVKHYKKLADGKLGVTFTVDVEAATEVARAYNEAGIRAEVICSKTSDFARSAILESFRQHKISQVVNVDLIGEGFDFPAIEVVSFGRPTESYGLYCQQFGRSLRILEGKEKAIIIDHVGNALRFGVPDLGREWTLDRREKRLSGPRNLAEMVKVCASCTGVFERFRVKCPYCGFVPEPSARSKPEFVDGDLKELDVVAMMGLRTQIAAVDMSALQYQESLLRKRVPLIGVKANVKRHLERQEAQRVLRESLAWWGAHQRVAGYSDSESYRRFYLQFGVDVMSAQALGAREASELNVAVNANMATKRINQQEQSNGQRS